jgi:hypothetical protein
MMRDAVIIRLLEIRAFSAPGARQTASTMLLHAIRISPDESALRAEVEEHMLTHHDGETVREVQSLIRELRLF